MYEMRLYILDIRKHYHEDEDRYAGAWFNCPVDLEEIKERLGVEQEEDFEIADYELPFALNPDMPLWEINVLCRMIQEIEGTPVGNELKEIQAKWFQNIEDFIDHKNEIRHYDVSDSAALAEYLIMEEHCFGSCRQNWCSTLTLLPTGMSWNKATLTSLLPAAYSAIRKAVSLWKK